MKSTLLLFSLLSMLIFSCKSDDDAQPSEPLQLLSSVTSDGQVYPVEYFSDHKIKKIKLTNEFAEFTYDNNGRISRVTKTDLETNEESVTTFEHDANGKIISFEFDDLTVDLDYNQASNSYSYTVPPNTFTFELNTNEEAQKVTQFNETTQTSVSWGYTFDTVHKGALANSNPITLYLFLIEENSLDLLLPFYQNPVATVFNSFGNYECENTFDEKGFVKNTSVLGREITFNYILE